jgi:hypothetical protein
VREWYEERWLAYKKQEAEERRIFVWVNESGVHLLPPGEARRLPLGIEPHRNRRATLIQRTPRSWEVNRIVRETVAGVQSNWRQVIGEGEFSLLLTGLRRLTQLVTEPLGASDRAMGSCCRAECEHSFFNMLHNCATSPLPGYAAPW